MPHDVTLIIMLAAAFGGALVLGWLAHRLRLPAIVGFLAAGVLIGPATPGYVADMALASQLAEIGVMLLMFGVGLHFSLDDLMKVRGIALPGALLQIAAALAMGFGLATWWDWSWGAGLVFGMTLSVASTVVLLKALEARGLLETSDGKIAVGWLVVEDLVMVLVLVLLPVVAPLMLSEGTGATVTGKALGAAIGLTVLKVTAFFVVMLVIGRRVYPKLLWAIAKTGNRELFTLAVVSSAIGIAVGAAALFDVSFALGAFFAGMMMRESDFSHRAAEESLPLRDAFAVLFFVSVGMLFDPAVLVEEPLRVLAVVGVVVVGKTIAAILVVRALRYPWRTALTVGGSLAQIGEFSFILAGLGLALGLLGQEAMNLIVAGAVVSIAINPLLFAAIEPLKRRLEAKGAAQALPQDLSDPLAVLPDHVDAQALRDHVVLVGYGRVGRVLAEQLAARGLPFVVVETQRDQVEALRARGQPAVLGDAQLPEVLVQAHLQHARLLVVAAPDLLAVRGIAKTAQALRPNIRVLLRTHSADEAELLAGAHLGEVFYAERELAIGLADRVSEVFKDGAAPSAGH
ncbi:cation:proton antiporter [Silanimonas algicola]